MSDTNINKIKAQAKSSLKKVILKPRVTEKAAYDAAKNQYIFEVAPSASKEQIKKAVIDIYKVTPTRINITNLPAKKVFVRGKRGVTSGVKKAVVFLKQGDKIEII